MNSCSVAVVIIAFNEEVNLPHALRSAIGWADQVFVVDSFSTDRTVEIAQDFGAEVCRHAFDNFGAQKNWALENLSITSDWVVFLDADEYLSDEIKEEIPEAVRRAPAEVNGFVTEIQYIYLGKWIKHGDLYRKLVRVVRRGCASYRVTGAYHEKMVVQGRVGRLKGRIVHNDHKTLHDWIDKQMIRVEMDVQARLRRQVPRQSRDSGKGNVTVEGGRSVWLKKGLGRLPSPVRPFAQFFYRYVLRLGFLDGWQGFIYHFLLQFWYPFMVEAIYLERRRRETTAGTSLPSVVDPGPVSASVGSLADPSSIWPRPEVPQR